jgi:hypothetical protein
MRADMSNLLYVGSSELEKLGFKNKKVEYFENAQLMGCQCDMPGLFYYTIRTTHHQASDRRRISKLDKT